MVGRSTNRERMTTNKSINPSYEYKNVQLMGPPLKWLRPSNVWVNYFLFLYQIQNYGSIVEEAKVFAEDSSTWEDCTTKFRRIMDHWGLHHQFR